MSYGHDTAIFEFIKSCKEINTSLSKCDMEDLAAVNTIENKVDLIIPMAENYLEKLNEAYTTDADKQILLALENACTHANNTLVVKFQTTKFEKHICKFFLKVKYLIGVLLVVFAVCCQKIKISYGKETVKYFISFFNTYTEFIIKDVVDDSMSDLFYKAEHHSNSVDNIGDDKLSINLLYSLYQVYLCEYEFAEAARHKDMILEFQLIESPEKTLEVMTTVYNACLKGLKTNLEKRLEFAYEQLIDTAISEIDKSMRQLLPSKLVISDDLNKLKHNLMQLKAEMCVKSENFEMASKTVDLMVSKYKMDKATFMLKISTIKNMYKDDNDKLCDSYIEVLKEYSQSLVAEKDFESLASITEFLNDFSTISLHKAIRCSEAILINNGLGPLPLQVAEKLYTNYMLLVTNKSISTDKDKLNYCYEAYELLDEVDTALLSEACANAIAILVLNSVDVTVKGEYLKSSTEWLEYLTDPRIKNSTNTQTLGIVLRRLMLCYLHTDDYENIYRVFNDEMNVEIQNQTISQVLLFKALCNEIETLDAGSTVFMQLFNTSLAKCKDILSTLQSSRMPTSKFYDTIYTCFKGMKSSNPMLSELLKYLLIETDTQEAVNTLEDLSKNFSYIRVLIIAIQLYSNQIHCDTDIKATLEKNYGVINKLLNKSHNYLTKFNDLKKVKDVSEKTETAKGSFGFNEIYWLAAVSFNMENLYYKNDIYLDDMNFADLSTGFINILLEDDNYTTEELKNELTERKARNACLKVFHRTEGSLFAQSDFKKTIGDLNKLIDAISDADDDAIDEKCVWEMQLAKLMLYNYFKDEKVSEMFDDSKVLGLLSSNDDFREGCFYVLLNNKDKPPQDSKFSKDAIMLLFHQCMNKMDLEKLLSCSRESISWLYDNDHSKEVVDFLNKVCFLVESKINDTLKEVLQEELDWFSTHCWNMSVVALMDENTDIGSTISQEWFDACLKFSKNISNDKTQSMMKLREQVLM